MGQSGGRLKPLHRAPQRGVPLSEERFPALGRSFAFGRADGMPGRYAEGFDPEAMKALDLAFDKACDALGLARTHDAVTETLARVVVEQARSGERDPDTLCAMTLSALRAGGASESDRAGPAADDVNGPSTSSQAPSAGGETRSCAEPDGR